MLEVVPTQTALRHTSLLFAAAVALAACNGTPTPKDAGGTAPPNICNAQSDAQSDAACQLTLATQACFYLDHVGKTLWLQATMPATLNAQSLLEIEASYSPSGGSPVELSLNVVTAAQAGIANGQNLHDPGAPGPIQITTTPATSLEGQPIYLIFSDATNSHADIRNEFCVTVNVVQDPDPNQAGVPTAVTLSAGSNGVETNTPPNPGVLSTPGRIDEYSFSVDSSIANPILYLSVTVPPNPDGGVLVPPIAYLMGYTLYDCGPAASASATACAGNPPTVPPGGSIVANANMPNVFLSVDLATAIKVLPGEMYVAEIAGVNSSQGDTNTVPGDIRVKYDFTIEEMPDLDPYDGPTPTPVAPTLGGAATTLSSGRLSYLPQNDSFAINVSSPSANTRIHYLITPGATGSGRFPALPNAGPRVTFVSTPVPASMGADPGEACNDDYDTCPNDTPNLTQGGPALGLVGQFCELDGGPQCLYSYRQEDPAFSMLGNFEGIIPVKAGTSVINLSYQWQGGSGADDVPYTLAITWLPEGPENQSAYHWSQATAINAGTLTADVPPSGSFPAPPTGATTLSGAFTIGDSLTDGTVQTVRGLNDYDAVPSTLDVYQITFPSVPDTTGNGATWELQYSVQNSGNNGPPVTLEMAPVYWDSETGAFMTQQASDPFVGLESLYYNTSGGVWWNAPSAETVWSQSMSIDPGSTTDTVQPAGCFCFQPSYLAGNSFFLYVTGGNRTSYADATYSIQMAMTTYPQPLGDGDGGICQWSDAGIPDGGTAAITTGCGMKPSTACSGSGSQCLANADCCGPQGMGVGVCNILTPCVPTGGGNGGMGDCSMNGFGTCQ